MRISATVLPLVVCGLHALSGIVSGQWTKLDNITGIGPRYSHKAAVFSGSVFVMGGFNIYSPSQMYCENDVWTTYENELNSWLPISGFPIARYDHGLVYWAEQEQFVLTAGYNCESTINDVQTSFDGVHWTGVLQTQPHPAIRGHVTITVGGQLYTLGGQDNNGTLYSQIWQSTDAASWQPSSPGPWSPRAYHGAINYKTRVYVMGGLMATGPAQATADVWASKPNDLTVWTLLTAQANWMPRFGFGYAGSTGRGMYVAGGQQEPGSVSSDLWWTTDGQQWRPINPNPPWSPRTMLTLVNVNDTTLVLNGGVDLTGTAFEDAYSYTIPH